MASEPEAIRMKFIHLQWLERCDAIIRLPGDSSGADAEVRRAEQLKLPVFPSVAAFLECFEHAKETQP